MTGDPTTCVSPDGADWLASASVFPHSVHALWAARPTTPRLLPCGTAFDVVNAPALFGRRMADRLWAAGPGTGPVALYRGRMLLFAAPGTAHRLPALLRWEEWGRGPASHGTAETIPPLLCHGPGDMVTVPPLVPANGTGTGAAFGAGAGAVARWLVAPDVRHPWLPGPAELLWACVRTVRAGREGSRRVIDFRSAGSGC